MTLVIAFNCLRVSLCFRARLKEFRSHLNAIYFLEAFEFSPVHLLLHHQFLLLLVLLLKLPTRQDTSLAYSLQALRMHLLKVSLVGVLLMIRHLAIPRILKIGSSRLDSWHGMETLVELLRALSIDCLVLLLLQYYLCLNMRILRGLLLMLLHSMIHILGRHHLGSIKLRLQRLGLLRDLLRDLVLGGNTSEKLGVLIWLH